MTVSIFSGGAPQEVLEALKPRFESIYGHSIEHHFEHVSVVEKWLAEGRKADVVLLPTPLMNRVGTFLEFLPDTRRKLARIGIGVIVPDAAQSPDIASKQSVRDMLMGARAIAVPKADGLTGSHIMKIMTTLGIADEVKSRLRHKPAIYGAGELVASGEADVGIYLASEIRSVKGAKLIGLLPASLQNYVEYSIGAPSSGAEAEAAMSYVDFLSNPENRSAWIAAGFETAQD